MTAPMIVEQPATVDTDNGPKVAHIVQKGDVARGYVDGADRRTVRRPVRADTRPRDAAGMRAVRPPTRHDRERPHGNN
jgi:hypothetical protein